MNNAIEVQGLETLWPNQPGYPTVWRRTSFMTPPEPEMLCLKLRFNGQEYRARMAHSAEGHRQLVEINELDDQGRREFDEWIATTPGWWAQVIGPHGRFFSSPYDTVEAAILGALSMPQQLWTQQHHVDGAAAQY